jgi:RNA polymerase sigma-70 factor (ECF subfamily)
MSIRTGKPGELVARLQRHANTSSSAELDQPFKTLIATFARNTDMIELPRTRTDGLLDRMETVKNFHSSSLPLPSGKRSAGFRMNLQKCVGSAFIRNASEKISSFMDPSGKKRVFSGRKNVFSSVQASSISLSSALAAQTQSENAAIAHGLKRQNPELLDELIELYQHRLLRYLLFLTGKREVAEDLFQETWMRVLLRGAQYNGKARFDTWLFTIARNLVIDLSRKRTMASLDEMSEGGEDDRPFEIAMSGPSPLEQFQSREDCAEVGEVLLKLEPTYREVLVLRFYEELSLEEIATVTRAPLSTVK